MIFHIPRAITSSDRFFLKSAFGRFSEPSPPLPQILLYIVQNIYLIVKDFKKINILYILFTCKLTNRNKWFNFPPFNPNGIFIEKVVRKYKLFTHSRVKNKQDEDDSVSLPANVLTLFFTFWFILHLQLNRYN